MTSGSILDLFIALLIGIALGGGALFLLLRSRLKEVNHPAQLRRVSLLEQVSEHVGKVAYVFNKYAALVIEIGPRRERMSARQHQELEELSSQLVEVYEQAAIAESKLLLLGEQRLEKALKLYTAKMAQFRKQIYPGRYQNTEHATALGREVSEMRDQFYAILSERFDQSAR